MSFFDPGEHECCPLGIGWNGLSSWTLPSASIRRDSDRARTPSMAEVPQDLKDLYIDELKDLWSANDQMQRTLKKIVPKASALVLKEMLAKSLGAFPLTPPCRRN